MQTADDGTAADVQPVNATHAQGVTGVVKEADHILSGEQPATAMASDPIAGAARRVLGQGRAPFGAGLMPVESSWLLRPGWMG